MRQRRTHCNHCGKECEFMRPLDKEDFEDNLEDLGWMVSVNKYQGDVYICPDHKQDVKENSCEAS